MRTLKLIVFGRLRHGVVKQMKLYTPKSLSNDAAELSLYQVRFTAFDKFLSDSSNSWAPLCERTMIQRNELMTRGWRDGDAEHRVGGGRPVRPQKKNCYLPQIGLIFRQELEGSRSMSVDSTVVQNVLWSFRSFISNGIHPFPSPRHLQNH